MEELAHIEDGLAVLKRGGTYHARVRIDGKYVYRSLKTGDLEQAKKAAQKVVCSGSAFLPTGAGTLWRSTTATT